jgi:hypothetical protein
MHSSPITRRHLPVRPNDEAEKRENALRYAFLNASSAIGHRPDAVRSTMDKAASTEARRPWKGMAEPLRAIAIEAAQRDRATQESTEELIMDAVLALAHYVLEPLESRLIGETTYLSVAQGSCRRASRRSRSQAEPDAGKLEDADRESGEAAMALQLHRGGLRRTHQYLRPNNPTIGLL